MSDIATAPNNATSDQADDPSLLKAHGTILNFQILNGKMAMWMFLASEVMFFTGLIGSYIVLRAGQDTWGDPTSEAYPLAIGLTAANTFLLICSSVTFVWGLQHYQMNNKTKGTIGMALTTFFGAVFVGVQVFEYYELISHRQMLPSGDIMSGCFYAMTSFHGLHVLLGVVALAVLTILGAKGKFGADNYAWVEFTGLYWHFIDLVWVFVFTFFYLI